MQLVGVATQRAWVFIAVEFQEVFLHPGSVHAANGLGSVLM